MKKVGIIMGSISDFEKVRPAVDYLKDLQIPYTVNVMSAHRTPDIVSDFSKTAAKEDYGVIIAAAGKAAHLAGVVAANTTLPVIGIPIKASCLEGLDSLLSTVQMPQGVPVATVAIDGAYNAAVLAAQILALSNSELSEKLSNQRKEMKEKAVQSNKDLQQLF